jgi:hypothetical protein
MSRWRCSGTVTLDKGEIVRVARSARNQRTKARPLPSASVASLVSSRSLAIRSSACDRYDQALFIDLVACHRLRQGRDYLGIVGEGIKTSHTRAVPSYEAVITRVPSGLNWAELTQPLMAQGLGQGLAAPGVPDPRGLI